jgi:Fur family iron response transcriptional regulator
MSTKESGEFDTLLIKHGISPTRQRRLIAELLFARHQHVSAEDVLKQLKQKNEGVAKATIYNTLGLFAQHGLVREVFVDPAKVYFDSNNQPHQHFYNIETGELLDISDDQLGQIRPPRLPKGTELDKVDIIFHIQPRT